MPVGKGSGELQGGGTYVSLVDTESNDFTMIVQTMEYKLSQCFKDTHSPYEVINQTAVFNVSGLPKSVEKLFVRRTQLIATSPIDPIEPFTESNTYFQRIEDVQIQQDGSFTLDLPINTITTVTTLSSADPQIPTIPPHTPFPRHYNDSLQGYPEGQGARYQIDQQGVFVAGPSRVNSTVTTLQQTVSAEPQEWHNWGNKVVFPHTFVGPSALTANVTVEVLPGLGFAAIGFNAQISHSNADTLLRVNSSGHWSILDKSGSISPGSDGWVRLALEVARDGTFRAFVGSNRVATGAFGTPSGWFPILAASFSGTGPNAEYRNLELEIIPTPTSTPPPTPTPPGPPSPAPRPGSGAQLVACDLEDPHQSWIFSGEDGGEAGVFRVSSNLSACLDAMVKILPAQVEDCSGPITKNDFQFTWSSATGLVKSVETRACQVKAHGTMCHYCLDAENGDKSKGVGFFDCKGDSNQVLVISLPPTCWCVHSHVMIRCGSLMHRLGGQQCSGRVTKALVCVLESTSLKLQRIFYTTKVKLCVRHTTALERRKTVTVKIH